MGGIAKCIAQRLAATLLLSGALLAPAAAATRQQSGGPSRPPVKGCAWETLSDEGLGLAAWVQRCDFGFRKIDFLVVGNAVNIRYSDGGSPQPVIEVLDLSQGESPLAGVRRVFREHTDRKLASRCMLVPDRTVRPAAGVERYTFVPDAAYRREVKAKANPNEVGDPACGDWGEAPDGIQYFEVHTKSRARKILFVRVGQDEPLFDAHTLRLIAPAHK